MFAVGIALLHLALDSLYPLHRDEMYLSQCARHFWLGSIDHAPATPWLLRQMLAIFDSPLLALRIVPAVGSAATILLMARATIRLSDDKRVAWLTAVLLAVSPVYIYIGGVASTNTIEHCVFAIAFCTWLEIILQPDQSHPIGWVVFGIAIAVGVASKFSAGLIAISMMVASLVSDGRRQFKTPWPYVAAVFICLGLLPAWLLCPPGESPIIGMLRLHHAARIRDVDQFDLLWGQFADLHTVALIAVGCAVAQWRRNTVYRAIVVAWIVAGLALIILHVKHYQWAPWHLAMVAIGSASLVRWSDRIATRRRRHLLWVALAVSGIASWSLTLPILPGHWRDKIGLVAVNRELVQFADWRNIAQQLAKIRDSAKLDLETPVVTSSYGTAAAIGRFGGEFGLPPPISGANSYYIWSRTISTASLQNATTVIWIDDPVIAAAAQCNHRKWIGRLLAPPPAPPGTSNRFDFPRDVYQCDFAPGELIKRWPMRTFD
jgi:hypothetical protein